MTVDPTLTDRPIAARYAAAEALLPHNLRDLVATPRVAPTWIDGSEAFWYRTKTDAGHAFVLVDPVEGSTAPAFDHDRMATALGTVLRGPVQPHALPFFAFALRDRTVRVTAEQQHLEVDLDTWAVRVVGPARIEESVSPDGRWAVGLRDHDLYVRDLATGAERPLTTDGTDAFGYGVLSDPASNPVLRENLGVASFPPLVVWSPDCSRFATHRLDQRDVERMHLLRAAPPGGGRPRVLSYRYALPGDADQPTADMFVFDVATGEATQAKTAPVHSPFVPGIAYGWVWWSADGSAVHWLSTDRGDRTATLHRLDPDTGVDTVVVEESSPTHVRVAPYHHERNIRVLTSGEVLWWSERSGWGHLYLYAADGSVTTVTSGPWLVRDVVAVDEDARRVLFTAAGRTPGVDPYIRELCSVSLDGGEVTAITADDLDHDVTASPSGRFLVDVMSRVDVPAISVLRDRTGEVVRELGRADATALFQTGYTPPERVRVKAADGETDIWCTIYAPVGLDPERAYPVVDEIYSGPQNTAAPTRFPLSGGPMAAAPAGPVFAALGFVWVAVDGRGTALRDRAFTDHNRTVRDADYIADHVAAIRQLAETRPWMDLDRVGIFGDSCGGFNAAKAMFLEPDFFKVGVASRGNHDDRLNHAWWGEKFYGLVEEFDYAGHANESLVDNLEGRLLLAHGEMDDNAVPHGTMRLVDALIRADKDFDLIVIPNDNHWFLQHGHYFIRRQWDYLVRHLMGEEPPTYRIAPIPLNPEVFGPLGG
jgi:dipeptidyl-peptidase 4